YKETLVVCPQILWSAFVPDVSLLCTGRLPVCQLMKSFLNANVDESQRAGPITYCTQAVYVNRERKRDRVCVCVCVCVCVFVCVSVCPPPSRQSISGPWPATKHALMLAHQRQIRNFSSWKYKRVCVCECVCVCVWVCVKAVECICVCVC